jgi:hypothetical protein
MRLLLQVIHIAFGTQPDIQVQPGKALQLAFFFAEKRKVLIVEVLRQKGRSFCIHFKAFIPLKGKLGMAFRRKAKNGHQKTEQRSSHGLIFDVNLRLDF